MVHTIGTYCPECGKIIRRYDKAWMSDGENAELPRMNAWNDGWTAAAKREFNPATRTLPHFQLLDSLYQKSIYLQQQS